METIAELKTICQTTAKKDISNVYMRYVCRSASIYLTRALIPTKVTPDQVSCAMIIVGVIAALVCLLPHPFFFLIGALLLQFWYILDCVDGELARYRSYQKNGQVIEDKTSLPMTGAYWDYLNHYIVHGLLPLTVSYGLFLYTTSSLCLLVGFAASITQILLLAIHDTQSRAFVHKIKKGTQTHWLGARPKVEVQESTEGKKGIGLLKLPFVVLHYLCTYPTVMNVATLAAILSLFIGFHHDFRPHFLWFYAVASSIVFLGLAYKNLHDLGLDKEFDEQFYFEKKD